MYSVALLSIFILLLSGITSGSPNSCQSDWYLTVTHIHAIPSGYAAALAKAGGDPSGFPTPSAPGIPIAGTGLTARKLCRETNNQLADIVKKHPGRLDFFGALPDWRDVEGTIEEIDYLYTTRKTAVGVDFYTTYGDHLPGDPMFRPIWEKLESVGALAFMHPTTVDIKPYLISGFLPQPIIDYPQQTTRAAMDLILRGVRSQTPSVDIILAHAGGTLPYVAQRAWHSLQVPQIANETTVDISEARAQIRRYYYDTALSNTPTQLKGLLENTDSSHILLGTDYPYAPREHIVAGFAEYLAFSKEHPEISPEVLTRNAKELILRRTVAGK